MKTLKDFDATEETGRLVLKTLTPENMSKDYAAWLNDAEVSKYLESRHVGQTPEGVVNYAREMRGSADSWLAGIFLKEGERHIGNIKIGPVNWRYGRADLGILIGDKACWNKGYAAEAIEGACRVAFEKIGLRRVAAGFYAGNKASIGAFRKAGFREEGLLRGYWVLDGAPEDHVWMGRLAGDKI